MLPKQREAWDVEDDWTGVTSPAERRKRQNRLNQRAYRKKRLLQRCAGLASDSISNSTSDEQEECSTETLPKAARCQFQRRHVNDDDNMGWLVSLGYINRHKVMEYKKKIFLNHSIRLRAPSDLGALTRLNVLNAVGSNAIALSLRFEDLDRDDCISPFNLLGPSLPNAPDISLSAPECLRPTNLQRTVTHHPWIDLFPIPGIRDNILRHLDVIDEDELCADLCGLEDPDSFAQAPVAVWGDPSDARNWEFGLHFMRKWNCLIRGCPEVLEATNYWRQKRGKMDIKFLVDEGLEKHAASGVRHS